MILVNFIVNLLSIEYELRTHIRELKTTYWDKHFKYKNLFYLPILLNLCLSYKNISSPVLMGLLVSFLLCAFSVFGNTGFLPLRCAPEHHDAP
jgi:hypothetical protein